MADDAFTLLVDEHYGSLYRFALSLARNASDACDLTQQTFYLWAKHGRGLREAAKAKSWLFTTLYREFLRGRRRDLRLAPLEEAPVEQAEGGADAEGLVSRLDGAELMEIVGGIDEAYRAPLVLFYLESLSYREIAETLDLPVGTVMSRLARAKAQLRAALEARAKPADVVPFEARAGERRKTT